MMGMSPRCYIPSFMEIGQPVQEKKIFKDSTIYGHGGHFDHVTSITLTNFHFLVPESFHTKFSFLYVNDLGPRSRNNLDLQYSHNFMKSISCLYLPTFRSQGSIVSEQSTVFTVSYRKA